MESWGRGIGTMVDECKRVGLPAPEINTDGNFVWVVFKYNRNSVVVTPQLMKVITVIRDNMMSAKEIMECIKLKDKTYFLDKYLYPAMEEGYVEQLYPEPTLKSKACLKCLYFTIIIFDLCRYLEYFSYLYTINQTE